MKRQSVYAAWPASTLMISRQCRGSITGHLRQPNLRIRHLMHQSNFICIWPSFMGTICSCLLKRKESFITMVTMWSNEFRIGLGERKMKGNCTTLPSFVRCSGCGVCSASCPKQAIHMEETAEGFYHPIINTDLCVSCGICQQVCYTNQKDQNGLVDCLHSKRYWAYAKNGTTLQNSASGGSLDIVKLCNSTRMACRRHGVFCRRKSSRFNLYWKRSGYCPDEWQQVYTYLYWNSSEGFAETVW